MDDKPYQIGLRHMKISYDSHWIHSSLSGISVMHFDLKSSAGDFLRFCLYLDIHLCSRYKTYRCIVPIHLFQLISTGGVFNSPINNLELVS